MTGTGRGRRLRAPAAVFVVAVVLAVAIAPSLGPGLGLRGASSSALAALSTNLEGWVQQDAPKDLGVDCTELVGVWGTSGTDVFAVASCGALLHYDGTGWSVASRGPQLDGQETWGGEVVGMWGASSSDIFLVANPGPPESDSGARGAAVLRYDGSAWTAPVDSLGDSIKMVDIWGNSSTDVYALACDVGAGDEGANFLVHYDGASWTQYWPADENDPLFGLALEAIWSSPGVGVFAVGSGVVDVYGAVVSYDGSQWTSMDPGTPNALSAVWGSSSSDVFAVGTEGTIVHFDGISWSTMVSGTTESLDAVWGSSSSDVYVLGDTPETRTTTILHYDGAGWSTMVSGETDGLRGLWGSSSADVFAVGAGATILHHGGTAGSLTAVTGAAGGMTETSAVLSGSLVDLGSAPLVDVCFEWGPTAAYGSTTAPQAMTAPGAFSGTIDGLSPGTGYHFRARAEGNTVAYGADAEFTTGAAGHIPPAVATGDPTMVSDNAVRLSGELTSLGTAASVTVSFVLGKTRGGPYTSETAGVVRTAAGTFSCDLAGLARGTTFYYRAKASGDGTGQGVEKSFTTTGLVPQVGGLMADSGRRGEEMTVTVYGSGLTGASEVGLGEGISVGQITIVGDGEIEVEISIDGDAASGERTVTVTTPWGTASLPGGFTVTGAEARVRLWIYLAAAAGGLVVVGLLVSLEVLLRRRRAR